MGHSDRVLFFARLIPSGAWKEAQLERHLERCPQCAARLATREETRRLLVGDSRARVGEADLDGAVAVVPGSDPRQLRRGLGKPGHGLDVPWV